MAAFSNARSAYMRFNRAFSISSSRSRCNSGIEAPAYFAFQLKYVFREMPCFRSNSATGTPASPSFSTATIWDSENRDFRMPPLLVWAPDKSTIQCLLGREAYGGIRRTMDIPMDQTEKRPPRVGGRLAKSLILL